LPICVRARRERRDPHTERLGSSAAPLSHSAAAVRRPSSACPSAALRAHLAALPASLCADWLTTDRVRGEARAAVSRAELSADPPLSVASASHSSERLQCTPLRAHAAHRSCRRMARRQRACACSAIGRVEWRATAVRRTRLGCLSRPSQLASSLWSHRCPSVALALSSPDAQPHIDSFRRLAGWHEHR